jgi:membrane fusion protein (multidrug efflux system)
MSFPSMRRRWRPAPLVLALLLAACSGGAPPASAPPEVGVIQLAPKPAEITVEYVAQTQAHNTAEIRPRVGGLLQKQAAFEGTTVKAGDVLFVIDQQPYIAALAQAKAALAQAQAALEQSRRDLARVEPLLKINAVSQQEYDAIVARNDANLASVDAAKAQLKTAELNLNYTTVTSPIDGIVGRAQFHVGGLVTAYMSLLTTVYAPDPMYVNFSVSERRILELQNRFGPQFDRHYESADTFKILLADGSTYPLAGRLNFIDAAVDPTTGTLPVRLEVRNPQNTLRTGQFARVVVVVDRISNAILVPQRAVVELQGKTSLWIVDGEGKAQSRDAVMGARIGTDWLVQAGAKAGDTVVVDGVQKLKPGMAVKAQARTPPAAAPAQNAGDAKT